MRGGDGNFSCEGAAVLTRLAVDGFTVIHRLRVSFRDNVAMVANRANTNGSVTVSTLNLYLNNHTRTSVIHANTTHTSLYTHFSLGSAPTTLH